MQFFTSSAKRAGQCHLSSGKIEPVSDYSMMKRSNSRDFLASSSRKSASRQHAENVHRSEVNAKNAVSQELSW
jgi:hypothetical protein